MRTLVPTKRDARRAHRAISTGILDCETQFRNRLIVPGIRYQKNAVRHPGQGNPDSAPCENTKALLNPENLRNPIALHAVHDSNWRWARLPGETARHAVPPSAKRPFPPPSELPVPDPVGATLRFAPLFTLFSCYAT